MNYRHSFHAGNFADVLKHAILVRILLHLNGKPTPYRVIDTHAGSGRYDLAADDASRTHEWKDGIARLDRSPLAPKAEALLAPYRETIAAIRAEHGPDAYPGSPWFCRHAMRPFDRLIAAELHAQPHAKLAEALARDARSKALAIDGWTTLRANIPPKERRGLVLIDPPYEQDNELQRAAEAVGAAHRKWPGGTILLWYPIKDRREIVRFGKSLAAFRLAKSLQIELSRNAEAGTRLRGTGLLVVNAPWTLQKEAQILLPALARVFWPGESSEIRVQTVATD